MPIRSGPRAQMRSRRLTHRSLRGRNAAAARIAGDLERAHDPLDGGNTFRDGLGLFFLLRRLDRPAEVHDPLAADDAETGQVRVTLRDQASLHFGLDARVGPRVD